MLWVKCQNYWTIGDNDACLVVSQESSGLCIRTGSTPTSFLIDVGANLIGGAVAECEGTTVERNSNHKLVWRAARIHPQLQSIILENKD